MPPTGISNLSSRIASAHCGGFAAATSWFRVAARTSPTRHNGRLFLNRRIRLPRTGSNSEPNKRSRREPRRRGKAGPCNGRKEPRPTSMPCTRIVRGGHVEPLSNSGRRGISCDNDAARAQLPTPHEPPATRCAPGAPNVQSYACETDMSGAFRPLSEQHGLTRREWRRGGPGRGQQRCKRPGVIDTTNIIHEQGGKRQLASMVVQIYSANLDSTLPSSLKRFNAFI